ncbi:hypothetical protein ACNKXS_14340 [Christiangramia marina]|uniref:hypothetical protein n=1 Tax=Christiangramia marina TaxID=409436 RepID=UPI003AA988CD
MLVNNSNSLSAVIQAIRKLAKVHSVYVIGHQASNTSASCTLYPMEKVHQTTHIYTLLVISYDLVEDPQKFMNEVYNKTQKISRIYSIHYTYKETSYRLNEGSNFLILLLSKGVMAYQQNADLYNLPHQILYHPTIYDGIKTAWELRHQRAKYFYDKTCICENITDESSRYLLFQEVVKQTCLGLLYLLWELKPTFYSIPFLLNLCGQFCDLPYNIYPKETFRSKDAYHKLCHARYLMDYPTSSYQADEQTNYIEKAVSQFLQEAEALAEQQLLELKQKHGKQDSL